MPYTSETALSLLPLPSSSSSSRILTFLKSLDDHCDLCAFGSTTLISGHSSSGCRDVIYQLLVNASIPEALGGAANFAPGEKGSGATGKRRRLVIDTEGSFSRERLEKVSEGLVSHLKKTQSKKCRSTGSPPDFSCIPTIEQIIGSVDVAQVQGPRELLGLLSSLDRRWSSLSYDLISIDTISSPLRSLTSNLLRMRSYLACCAALSSLSRKTGSCVVCSNHMTSDGDGNQVPSLGHDAESNFDQAFRTRVDQRRNANVLEVWKCDRGGRKDVFFTVGDRGVRDAK